MADPNEIKKIQDVLIELGHQRAGVVSASLSVEEDDSPEAFEYFSWWTEAIDERIAYNMARLLSIQS